MTRITPRIAMELVAHEAIVTEAYYDNAKRPRLTWGIGVTSASGHAVERYKDKPTSVKRCIEVYLWLLETKYLPDVLAAFEGRTLTENELGAALSFHYNTGAIRRADWVTRLLAGDRSGARRHLETHYLNGGALTERREAEARLFFDGTWSASGKATVYAVRKPSYQPDFRHPARIDISVTLQQLLGGQ